MKTFILFFFFSTIAFSQSINTLRLEKPTQNSDEQQISRLVQTILQLYGTSFKYYNELWNKNYRITKLGKEYSIDILNNEKNESQVKSKIIERVKLNWIKEENGNYSLMFQKKQMDKLIDRKKLNINELSLSPNNLDSIINTDQFLKDICIGTDPVTHDCYNKVFNRALALGHVVDENGNRSLLFYDIEDGLILPYEGGEKLIEVDKRWCSLIHFDRALTSNIWHYCDIGSGDNQLYCPTSIAYGRETIDGGTTTYPIYVSDYGNNRIISVDYVARNPLLGSGFNSDTWRVLNNSAISPFDIGIFKAESTLDDKIWISEAPIKNPSLACLNMDGSLVQRVIGYKDTNSSIIYLFEPGSEMRLSVFHYYFSSLSFVDNIRNNLVCCQLNDDGTAHLENYGNDYILIAHDVERFPADVKINSVAFQKTSINTIGWPYLWVTSGYTPPYYSTSQNLIHCFKMNSNSHLQYIASSSRPVSTDWDFVDLNNISVNNGYYDIFTIENWSNAYGIRQFRPFVGIRDVMLHQYCADSVDYMKWQSVLTNDCNIDLTAYRKNSSNSWESVIIKKINGWSYNSNVASIYRLAGNTESDGDRMINIKLDLPLSDYILGNQIRLHSKLYPEWTTEYYVERDDTTFIQKACIPKPGGCPFLYVKNGNNDYIADNNILHRSEFSGSGDITDKYRLQTTPQISYNQMELSIVENENDSGYINQVKLYAVDFPFNLVMGVTENNSIVLFDSTQVVASDLVKLGTKDITSHVNYFNPSGPVDGAINDSLYAHFSNSVSKSKNTQANTLKKSDNTSNEGSKVTITDGSGGKNPNFVFIANIGNHVYPNPSGKDTGGALTATSIYSNVVTSMFARRELNSLVILPLFGDSNKVDNLYIKWQSDYRLKYLGMANIQYSGYYITEIPMNNALYITKASSNDVSRSLRDVDTNYALVNSSGLIKMMFDVTNLPSIPNKYVRAYVIEVNGHYFAGTNTNANLHKPDEEIPLTYKLSQNYPNPFNPSTKINYEIASDNKVKLVIYDILGREVIKLVNDEFKKAGRYSINFDGTNLASGVYFYRIESGSFIQSKKMVLIK